MNEVNKEKKIKKPEDIVWKSLERFLFVFNMFSDEIKRAYDLQIPTTQPDFFYAFKDHPDIKDLICLANCNASAKTLCDLYCELTKKEYNIRVNKDGHLEVTEYRYTEFDRYEQVIFTGKEYNDVVYNKGYSVKTHSCASIDEVNSELASMGINYTAVSFRDAAYKIFEEKKYLDLGYKKMSDGYGTYIVAENGLILSLDKCVQYSEDADAEKELTDFIELATKK